MTVDVGKVAEVCGRSVAVLLDPLADLRWRDAPARPPLDQTAPVIDESAVSNNIIWGCDSVSTTRCRRTGGQ